jgi:hypothetical protein
MAQVLVGGNKMSRRMKIIIVAIVVICLITPIYMAISKISERQEKQTTIPSQSTDISRQADLNPTGRSVHQTEEEKIVKASKKDVNISKAKLTNDIEEAIINADKKNADRNIKDFKSIVVEFQIPQEYQDKIIRFIKSGYSIPEICISYEFLVDGYGNMDELKALLDEEQGGKDWNTIFRDYWKN